MDTGCYEAFGEHGEHQHGDSIEEDHVMYTGGVVEEEEGVTTDDVKLGAAGQPAEEVSQEDRDESSSSYGLYDLYAGADIYQNATWLDLQLQHSGSESVGGEGGAREIDEGRRAQYINNLLNDDGGEVDEEGYTMYARVPDGDAFVDDEDDDEERDLDAEETYPEEPPSTFPQFKTPGNPYSNVLASTSMEEMMKSSSSDSLSEGAGTDSNVDAESNSKDKPDGKSFKLAYGAMELGKAKEVCESDCEPDVGRCPEGRKAMKDGMAFDPSLDWNERYQSLRERMSRFTQDSTCPERIEVFSALAMLCRDFNSTAKMLGKIIISERFLTRDQKTIKPSLTLGGTAGGEKYVCSRILFKFATDHRSLYGGGDEGDVAAAKVAGLDLKGLMSIQSTDESLSLPLMTLVDYRGFRLIAMSMLPIDDSTIVYGSPDAGRTVHKKDDNFNERIRDMAGKLNLKSHMAGLSKKKGGAPQEVHTAVDIEGHYGRDGRYYLLDFARTMPPELPDLGRKDFRTSHLFRLLRAELVCTNPLPLCPDAFSGFIFSHNKFDEHNNEVADATNRMYEIVIPRVAKFLNRTGVKVMRTYETKKKKRMEEANGTPLGDEDEVKLLEESYGRVNIQEILHRYGINLRHLGRVRELTSDVVIRKLLLIEMVARASKCILYRKLRQLMKVLRYPMEQPYHALAVAQYNTTFGTSTESAVFWNTELKSELMSKFPRSLSHAERGVKTCLKAQLFFQTEGLPCPRSMLFEKMSALTGVKFGNRLSQLSRCVRYAICQPFDESDVESMEPIVKVTVSMEQALAMVNKVKAFQYPTDSVSFRYFMDRCMTHLHNALIRQPLNVDILHKTVCMNLLSPYGSRAEAFELGRIMYKASPHTASMLFLPFLKHFYDSKEYILMKKLYTFVSLVAPQETIVRQQFSQQMATINMIKAVS
eukprot:TRINITY_DN469_c0_g2_i1.p1 TRINITY_DN469_c0_g2~~TRINITY_DN469_c0_g2_i1.p1  ORF type:complete len:931 (-),score=200.38 TRINITY_DN469_c0_g2_i1:64-2856(-)